MDSPIEIKNIGGIYAGKTSLQKGLNAIQASNWQGKSSFISAIKSVMGVSKPLTEGEEYGYVTLELEEETHRVEFRREGDSIVRSGDPYLTNELSLVYADYFAFLDGDNEIRKAVRHNENLEGILTRPLDIENIDEQIADLKRERKQVESKLSRAKDAAERLPSVENQITQLESKLDTLRAKQANIRTGRTDTSELAKKRDELSDLRAEERSLESRINQHETSIDRINQKLEENRQELEEHEVPDYDDVTDSLEEHRSELQEIERDIELLRSLYSTNKRILEEDRVELLRSVEHGLLEDKLQCWVCGTDTDKEAVEEQISELGTHISELESNADTRRQQVAELQSKLDEERRAEQRVEKLEREISELEEKLEDRKQDRQDTIDRLETVTGEIETLNQDVNELNEKVTDIESDIKIAERDLSEAREERTETKAEANRRQSLENEHEVLTEEIQELKNRRDRVKREMQEIFDVTISEIIQMFDTGFDGAHLTGQFELVVARDGREAKLDTLSEGERELLGVITALAGNEVYEVRNEVPVMLLDELGGFADENLSILMKYLQERAEYVVFTTFPEHPVNSSTIEIDDGWDVVSRQMTSG